MNKALLTEEAQRFIHQNLNDKVSKVLLKGASIPNVTIQELVEQMEAKAKSEKKLPTFFSTPSSYYPNKLHIEQTSSEISAAYKSQLVSGHTIVDITGGFGVDCLYFSKHFEEVIHCETNEQLSRIAQHNFGQLGIENVHFIAEDGLAFLKKANRTVDCIYIDPSRRHEHKGKVFFLKDCEPNVPKYLELFFQFSDELLIKTSPLLDIKAGLKELGCVAEIHVVAIKNEVKEVLWLLKKQQKTGPVVTTVNIKPNGTEVFKFELHDETHQELSLSSPAGYLYEPNAAVMKSGGFKSLSKQMGLAQLHEHSHLYSSDVLVDFPGRRFKINQVIPYQKKLVKKVIPRKANISTRNFPESVSQLRQKFKISDGGSDYLFFTTNLDIEKIVLLCKKQQP